MNGYEARAAIAQAEEERQLEAGGPTPAVKERRAALLIDTAGHEIGIARTLKTGIARTMILESAARKLNTSGVMLGERPLELPPPAFQRTCLRR